MIQINQRKIIKKNLLKFLKNQMKYIYKKTVEKQSNTIN